jgi:hypothetical protein
MQPRAMINLPSFYYTPLSVLARFLWSHSWGFNRMQAVIAVTNELASKDEKKNTIIEI